MRGALLAVSVSALLGNTRVPLVPPEEVYSLRRSAKVREPYTTKSRESRAEARARKKAERQRRKGSR